MADLRKLKDRAAEHARKGRFDKAVELLSVVTTAEPKDLASKQKLGEALRRAGDLRDAVKVYREVVDAYAGQGELIKAIAVCKVILDVDPKHADTQAALADLYARRQQEPSRPVGLTPGRGLATAVADAPPPREPVLEIEPLAGGAAEEPEPPGPDGAPAWLERSAAMVVPPPPPEVAAARAAALGSVMEDLGGDEPLPLEPARAPTPVAAPPIARAAPPPVAAPPPSAPPIARAAPPPPVAAPPIARAAPPPAPPPPRDEPLPADAFAAALPADAFAAALAGGDEPLDAEAEVEEELEPLPIEVEPDEPEPPARELPHVPLFSDLSREAFVALAERLAVVSVPAGAPVLREGERGRSLHVVVSGRLRVEKARPEGPIVLARIGEGDFFGEMALLSGEPRMASVVAEEDAQLLEIGADLLADLCRQHPSVAVSLTRFYRRRLLSNALATSPVFLPFSAEDRQELLRRFRSREAKPGEVLVREGQRSEGLFVVLSGRYEVVRGAGGAAARVATLREGDLFGEMSCLRKQPAAASVVARRRGIVLQLPRADFDEVTSSHPQVLELVSGLADERLQSLETVARAAAGGPGPYLV